MNHGRYAFDVAVLENALPLLTGRTVGLVTTIQHIRLIPAMEAFLNPPGITALVAEGSGRTPVRGQVLGCSFAAARVSGADEILFVGTGTLSPYRYCNRHQGTGDCTGSAHRNCTGGAWGFSYAPPFCGH